MMRLTAYISGRVQRTGYRAKVVSLAKEMGLVGFVQNRPEGLVLVIAESDNKDDLERLASAIKIKNALINVERVSAEYSYGSGEYTTFRKITGPEEVGERLDDGIEILKELVVGLNNLTVITKNGFETLNGKMDKMLDKQDQMLDKQDQMLDKQDQMLDKQDQMLDKQDQMLDKQDQMLDKQDQMLDKQDETIEEIQGLREDTMRRSDEKLSRIEKDIRLIKSKVGIR